MTRAYLQHPPSRQRRLLPLLAAALLTACMGGGGGGGGDGPVHIDYDLVFDSTGADGIARLQRATPGSGTVLPVAGGMPGVRPSANPAGTLLLFAARDTTDPLAPSLLYQLDLASAQSRLLSIQTMAVELEPSFSPVDDRIVYTSQAEDGGGDIVVARLKDGALGELKNLTPRASAQSDPDRTPAWSPDGSRIAFTAYRAGGPAIWVMDADGGNPRMVTSVGNWGDFSPTWSPDGQTLAFQRNDGNADGSSRTRIGFVPAAGGTPRFLALAGNAYEPRFSPDGQRIVFSGKLDGDEGDIYVADLDGQILHRIGTPNADRHPAWIRRTP